MPKENLTRPNIQAMLGILSLFEDLLNDLLKGEYVYVLDTQLEQFIKQRETFEHYLKLPFDKQERYCHILTLYRQSLYQIACLYEEAGCVNDAIEYHLKAILQGRINRLFTSGPNQTDTPLPLPKDKLLSGLAALLGVGQPQNIDAAVDQFNNCIKNHNRPYHAHLFLGLIYFYGLNGSYDLSKARTHFMQAREGDIALVKQYMGICQIEQRNFHCGKKNLRAAAKKGLPLAQTTLAMMYEQGYGMFSQHSEKSRQLSSLAQLQRQTQNTAENITFISLV